jgi:hypothetical protein
LIHHHLIPYSYLVSTNMRNEVIPTNLRNGPMMHHYILDKVIPQTKHPLHGLRRELAGDRTCRLMDPDRLKVPDCLLSVVNESITVLFKQ